MNFDSIEGLSDEDINTLYSDEEMLSNWYGTWCKTVHADASSRCISSVSAYAKADHCGLSCVQTIEFSESAMNAKCNELCGAGSMTKLLFHFYFSRGEYRHDKNYGFYCPAIGYVNGGSYWVHCYHYFEGTCAGMYHHHHLWHINHRHYTNHYYATSGAQWSLQSTTCRTLLNR